MEKITFQFQATPCPVEHLNFKKRKYGESDELVIQDKYPFSKATFSVPSQDWQCHLDNLQSIQPDAVIFTSINAKPKTETSLPMTVFDIVNNNTTPVNTDLESLKESLNAITIANLEQATVNQAASDLWHLHRAGRITSSRMHQVYTLKEHTSKKT